MENENPTDDVIVEKEVVENQEQTTDGVTIDAQETQQQEVEVQPEDREDYWKNRAHELERKQSNLVDNLPKMIEETIIKTTKKEESQKEYSISELENYALEHPEHRPWVEEEKSKVQEKKFRKLLDAEKKEQVQLNRKHQSEMKILNDPKYADAFVSDASGAKVFNSQSPLAHAIHSYMNDTRLKGQPDSLEIASKLAYADLVDKSSNKKDETVDNLKRQNTKLKQSTMVEGGGVINNVPTPDPYENAVNNLRKTGNRKDGEVAVKEYIKKTLGVK